MALIVEDGTGLSTAEAYCSVADADTYHINRANALWTGTDAAKEAALRKATEYLDGTFKMRWKGCRVLSTQALDWPRIGVYNESGFYIPSESLPTSLVHATAELALRALTGTLDADIAVSGTVIQQQRKLGPLETNTRYTGTSQQPSYPLILKRIKDLIISGSKIVRG